MRTCRIRPDTITGIAATFIAVLALVGSLFEAAETRRHNRLSVKPVLSFETEVAQDDTVQTIRLKNLGTGPAIIKSFSVYANDKPVQKLGNDPWGSVIESLNLADIAFKYFWYSPGDVIGINEEKSVLTIKEEDYEKSDNKQVWAKAISRINVIIEYASIYDEGFVVRYQSVRSSPAKNR
jgi:hypothetical protein